MGEEIKSPWDICLRQINGTSERRGEGMTRKKVTDWIEGDNKVLLTAWARNGLDNKQIAHNIGITEKHCTNGKEK